MRTSFPKDRIGFVLAEGVHEAGRALLEREGFCVETHAGALTGAGLGAAAGSAHVIGIRSKTTIDGPMIADSPRLLAIGCYCAGTNQVDVDAAADAGIPVFNAPFSNTRSVAEMTIAEVIALHRRMFDRSHAMHAGQWDKSASGSHEVRGRTLGIVGYGHIGSQVSVLAEALGMRVVFYDVGAKLPLGNARVARSLDELLAASDAVTLHVPATAATRSIIGDAQIRRMKPGAYLINNARGSVVDVDALARALGSGHLGGAALDVFPEEPASVDAGFASPLRGMPNVILTPHIGGSTIEAQRAIAEEVTGKLIRFINIGSTLGAVNVPEVDLPEQARPAPEDGRRPHRILNFHRNEPGALNEINGVIAGLGGNVNAQFLRTSGAVGYVVLDVDPTDGDAIAAGIGALPGSVRTRVLW